MWTFEPLDSRGNPLFVNNTDVGNEGKGFKLEGYGKVIQISFRSNDLHTTLKVKVDNRDWNLINNGYCLTTISDGRGLGYANIEKRGEEYIYTFTLPIIFKEVIEINVFNSQMRASLKDLHIYYLKKC